MPTQSVAKQIKAFLDKHTLNLSPAMAAQAVVKQIKGTYNGRWDRIGSKRLLFVMNEGTSIFEHMEAYADLASQFGAVNFTGNSRWFELFLSKPSEHSTFTSIKDLEKCIYAARRFGNAYSGIVCIDISDWSDSFDSMLFWRFLSSLNTYPQSTVFAFSLYSNDKSHVLNAERVLSKCMPLQVIKDPAWKAVESNKQIGFGVERNDL